MNTKPKVEYIGKAVLIICLIMIAACAKFGEHFNRAAGIHPEPGPVHNPGSIAIPAEFNTVWYRTEDRRLFSAYLASGKLTINEHGIKFEADTDVLNINTNDIHSIAWGKMSGDPMNSWAIIKYGSPEKLAGFKDGRGFGWEKDSNLIYSTLKYSVEVLGGHKPTIEPPYASGWLDVVHGGLLASAMEEMTINISLKNKFVNPTWVKVEFLKPDLSLACEEVKMIAKEESFVCPQATVLSDQYYPIYMSVFLDKDLSKLVEKTGTRIRFPQKVIETLKEIQKEL